jgi:hypothetical protein
MVYKPEIAVGFRDEPEWAYSERLEGRFHEGARDSTQIYFFVQRDLCLAGVCVAEVRFLPSKSYRDPWYPIRKPLLKPSTG